MIDKFTENKAQAMSDYLDWATTERDTASGNETADAPRGAAAASTRRQDLVRLILFGSASIAVYVLVFTVPYSIEVGLARPLLHFGHISAPTLGSTLAYVVAITTLFALYGGALRLCRRLEGWSAALITVVGLGGLAALALLPMYPAFSLDVFYYMAADRIWIVYRENPFVVPPLQIPQDPFFPYTSWGHYALPYGPLWPWITAATSAATGGSVPATLLTFKALGVLGYLGSSLLVCWAAKLHPDRRVTACCVFAWNPLVLLELAGNAHNDAIALVPAALALGLWARRASRSVAIALAVSYLVKATVIVLAPALLWGSLRRAINHRRLPSWILTHLLPSAVLIAAAWLPFWNERSAAGLLREADQYYMSVTALAIAPFDQPWRGAAARVIQAVLLVGYALYFRSQLRDLASEGPRALNATWKLTTFYFLLVAPFYSAWYMVWLTLLAAIIADRRVAVLTTLLCLGGLSTYVVQFVVGPLIPSLASAQINALGVLAASGPFLLGLWLGHRLGFFPAVGSATLDSASAQWAEVPAR